jgi:5-methylthioadenosine/S-adenosylhomocysteine deaminase
VLTPSINKIQARDPHLFPAWEVLRMATIEGAQPLGLVDEAGSLVAGKQADLVRWRPRARR